MKTIVTQGGIRTWLNARENKFIKDHFDAQELLEHSELNERELYIAQNLVTKGVLNKDTANNAVSYKLNINKMAR